MIRYGCSLLWVIFVLSLAGCSKNPPPNVLIVTIDTMRADYAGYAGSELDCTVMLDALAARGTWFSTCLASQPLTLPSHASIMTGLYPQTHGVRNNGTYVLSEDVPTLAELLREDGYATHAIVSAYVLDSQFGLDQGFDSYDDDLSRGPKQKMFMFKEIQAERTAVKAVRWLLQERPKDKPFFLWVHFFDPHADYEPPPDIAARFPDNPYAGEIAYADRELGRIIASLDDEGLLDETVVVAVSDHGEGLGEHGEKTHGIFIYETTTRVPLMMCGPGIPPGNRVDELVRTIDIFPTILDLLDLDSSAKIDGENLQPLMKGKKDPRTAYLECFVPRFNFGWSELRGVRDATSKVIHAPRPEAYDLSSDPNELRDLASDGGVPQHSDELWEELLEVVEVDPFTHGEHRQQELDPETEKKLAALGYLWGTTDEDEKDLPDPKDCVVYFERFQAAQNLIRLGEYPEAIEAITHLLTEDPENVIALGSLANALARTGDKQRALEVYQKMIQLDPTREAAYLGSAGILAEMNRLDEAEQLIRTVIEMQPENPSGYNALGDFYLEQEKFEDAESWFRKALEVDEHSMLAASGLGNCLNRAGRIEEANTLLTKAYNHDPGSHAVTYNLAVVSERLGDVVRAEKLYRESIRLEPDHSMSWNNLGSLLDRQQKRPEAIRMIAKAHELDPDNVEATYNLGALLLASGEPQKALPLLEEALVKNPNLMRAAMQRAQALEALGRKQDALTAWRQIFLHQAGAGLQVARLELSFGREEEARKVLQQLLERDGDRARQAIERIPELQALLQPSDAED